MKPATTLVVLSLLSAAALQGQSLMCPPVTSGSSCMAWHYHVLVYQPDSRKSVELTGINQFSSQASCEQARDLDLKRNAAVVDQIRRTRTDTQYGGDQPGPCHCDGTMVQNSPRFLTDAQRQAERRLAQDVRWRVREKLLESGLSTDSELVRSAAQPSLASFATPLRPGVVAPPADAKPDGVEAASQLRLSRLESDRSSQPSIDLPLVDLAASEVAAIAASSPNQSVPLADPPAATAGATATQPAPSAARTEPANAMSQAGPASSKILITNQPLPADATALTHAANSGTKSPVIAVTTPPPAPQPLAVSTPAPAAVTDPPSTLLQPVPVPLTDVRVQDEPATEAAEGFISYETERIQNVLKASSAISDENIKARIFESCLQRAQLLANLRSLIEGSGTKSRLAAAARAAREEGDRITLVTALFGNEVAAHWAPKDAAEVVMPLAHDDDPEKLLRDSAGRATVAQRKLALYTLLATTQPTESQQLWLTGVVESFLP